MQSAIQDATLTKHVVTKNNPVPVHETHTNMPSVESVEIVKLSPLTLGTGEIEDTTHVMNSPKKRIDMFVGRIVDGFLSMGGILHSLVILTLTMGILWNFLAFSSVEGNHLLLEGVAMFTKTFTKTLVTDSLIFAWRRDGVWLPPEFTDKDTNSNFIIFDDGSDCIRSVTCDDDWQKVFDDWKSGETERRLASNILPNWERAIREFDDEDSQYWSYRWNYRGVDIEDIPRWKTPPIKPHLFVWKRQGDWIPPGPPEFSNQSMNVNFISDVGNEFLCLGVPNAMIRRATRSVAHPGTASVSARASFVTRDLPVLGDFRGNVTDVTDVDGSSIVTTHDTEMAKRAIDAMDQYKSNANEAVYNSGAKTEALMFKAVAVELSADRGEVDNDKDAATSPIVMKGLSSYKNVMVMARKETERSERL